MSDKNLRRLIVMRHAKSSWNSAATTDHARPLNKRGKYDAPRVAEHLVQLGWQPQLVLSSDSARTRETMRLMETVFSCDLEVQFWRELYLSGVEQVIGFMAQVDDKIHTTMVLGHNPGWEYVVSHLCEEYVVLKTATAALLEVHSHSWNDAIRSGGDWVLKDVIYPRELSSGREGKASD